MKQVKGKYRRLENGLPYRLPEDLDNGHNPSCFPVTDDDIELTKAPKMDVSEFSKYDWRDGVINKDNKTHEIEMKDERDQIIKQNNPNPYRDKVEEKIKHIRENEERRMNLEAGWHCEKDEDKVKLSPAPKTNVPIKGYNCNNNMSFAELEKERSHGPILDMFIQDGKEHEAEQIKKNVKKMMERGMLSEKEEKVIREKFGKTKKEYEAPNCEVLEPDKTEEWKGHTPEGDLGVTDYSIPGDICLSLRKHGWFVCNKNENPFIWESRYEELRKTKEEPSFTDRVKRCFGLDCYNTASYVSTGEDYEIQPNSFADIVWKLNDLHERKNHDYGNAAHESYKEFGLISYIIRLNDKMKRLKSLTKPGAEQQVKEESIVDTLMDLAAYSIMAIESLKSDE